MIATVSMDNEFLPTLHSMWMRCDMEAFHYGDVIMGAIASQITSLTIVYSTVYLDADQRKHQSSASRAFVRGIHRGPVNSPHNWPVTRKMFPFDDFIMFHWLFLWCLVSHEVPNRLMYLGLLVLFKQNMENIFILFVPFDIFPYG